MQARSDATDGISISGLSLPVYSKKARHAGHFVDFLKLWGGIWGEKVLFLKSGARCGSHDKSITLRYYYFY
jgi:hypothetical protein